MCALLAPRQIHDAGHPSHVLPMAIHRSVHEAKGSGCGRLLGKAQYAIFWILNRSRCTESKCTATFHATFDQYPGSIMQHPTAVAVGARASSRMLSSGVEIEGLGRSAGLAATWGRRRRHRIHTRCCRACAAAILLSEEGGRCHELATELLAAGSAAATEARQPRFRR